MNPLRRIAAAGVVAALAVGVSPTPSQAQTEGGLGGFALEALAVPVSVIFDMPSANIPAAPLMEWDLAYSRARLESGPIGHALASPLWPGEAVGTIGPFLSSEVNNQMRQNGAPDGVQAPTIPSWPGKAEAFHPQGPTTDDRSLGGPAQMRATAEANITEAVTTLTNVGLDGVFDVAAVRSVARTVASTSEATSEVKATLSDVSIADGLIEIEKVTSTAIVTSDGTAATVDGDTKISGLTIADTPFVYDGDGLRAADGGDDGALNKALGDATGAALDALGVKVMLTPASDIVDGPTADRVSGALMITFENKVVEQMYESMPEELVQGLRQVTAARGDQTMSIVLGGIAASSAASPPFVFDIGDGGFGGGDFGGGGGFDTGSTDLGDTQVLSSGTSGDEVSNESVASPPPAGQRLNRIGVQPAFSGPVDVGGVSVGAALLGIIGLLGGARLMRKISDTLLFAGAKEEPCPLDEP